MTEVTVSKKEFLEMQRIVRAVALTVPCPDCRAMPGEWCKSNFDCNELWRAGMLIDKKI